jgi:hypothetical protein
VAGGFAAEVIAAVRERWQWMRLIAVADREVEGANAVVASLDDVRDAVKGLPSPGGPVGPVRL